MWLTDESHVRKVIHEFNEEGFDSCALSIGAGDPAGSPRERQRAVAVAGARPDTQGVPLTRWSLDRLSAYLAEHGVQISPIHLWRLLAEAGLSFQRTRSWKASPDPDYETRAARVLELYAAAPFDGPVISFDQMGPISLKPIHGAGWAPRSRPSDCARPTTASTGSATSSARSTSTATGSTPACDPAAPARRARVHAHDPTGATRPARRSTGSRTTSSANWTPDIREFAATNRIELVPTPTYASYLNRIESHFRPIQEFVFNNTDYPDWDTAQTSRRRLHHPPQRRRPRPPHRRPRTQTPNRRMNPLQVKPFGWTH